MFDCSHCNLKLTSIRTARNHHPKCPMVKGSELVCRDFIGSACDDCFSNRSETIQITNLAPLEKMPSHEKHSATSDAEFERVTEYSKKAAKLFAGKKKFTVAEMSESDEDFAWDVMMQLQKCAENCCSMAAIQVNRNRSDAGLKKKPFKPLRLLLWIFICSTKCNNSDSDALTEEFTLCIPRAYTVS
jgi:hypothetical protein